MKKLALSLVTLCTAIAASFGQMGSDNPTGISGKFNGNVETAGSYDPYTGNATRSVTDIVVPGAVGNYPLGFTRTMNTRYTPGVDTLQFGSSGTWRHNYQWSIDSVYTMSNTGRPTSYTVNYPDGRRVTFAASGAHPFGVSDRFQQMASDTATECFLLLPDGGKIRFAVETYRFAPTFEEPQGSSQFDFTVTAIIDPHGLTTTYAWQGDGSLIITEPAGRTLRLYYTSTPTMTDSGYISQRLDRVVASDGRTVQYRYSETTTANGTKYVRLDSVEYYGDTTNKALYTYQNSNIDVNGRPLMSTCVDPMYPGPMWQIAYTFVPNATGVVYGQLESEKYCSYNSGTQTYTVGAAVSTLTKPTSTSRVETRGDSPTRTFNYSSGKLINWTDFKGVTASQTFGTDGFVATATDYNGNVTSFTRNSVTGAVTQTTFPLTPPDSTAATTSTTLGWASCPDVNNRDANNPYFPYSGTNERGYAVVYTRDANKRVTLITYPDGATESFTYNSFGQVLTHRLKTGGLQKFVYNASGQLTEYRDPYHLDTADSQNPTVPTNATPTLRYIYHANGTDGAGLVASIQDAANNTTTFAYNKRGLLLTKTEPATTGSVSTTVSNAYNNANGTLASTTNELNATVSYGYDNYKRVTSITPPPAASGSPSPTPTRTFYSKNQSETDDYTHTAAAPSLVKLPSGNKSSVIYDNNFRKTSSIAAPGTVNGTTTYTYDNNGNLKTVKDPRGQASGAYSEYFYDARNRLIHFRNPIAAERHSGTYTTSWTYDKAGNKLTQKSANEQTVTFDSYDSMNRLLQQTAPQTGSINAVTKYTYWPSGQLKTMQDPKNSGGAAGTNVYSYTYDLMGRKVTLAYPPAVNGGTIRSESWSYDTRGNLSTFTNRAGNVQTFKAYDQRNRSSGFTWSSSTAPEVTVAYDDASRVTRIENTDAVVVNEYWNDNQLKSQEEWATADSANKRKIQYDYTVDGQRHHATYPSGEYFGYAYNDRNLLEGIWVQETGQFETHYLYDVSGNVNSRHVRGPSWINSWYNNRDAMNRLNAVGHDFSGTTRTFGYTYGDKMGDRTQITHDSGLASPLPLTETHTYDLAQQSLAATLGGTTNTFTYDANGNRSALNGGGTYIINNLNQYTLFDTKAATYDNNGNLWTYDGWTYTYDAQNRLKRAVKGTIDHTFKYDPLNRKISQTAGATTTYFAWDGWNLIEEYTAGSSVPAAWYIYGNGEIVERFVGTTRTFYFQDALGNTSHITDASNNLLENYRYSRTGVPTVYNAAGVQQSTAPQVKHLFQGQLWMHELAANDYRNRVQLPAMSVFMQPDPIGHGGDPTNIYRFCGNNAINLTDPFGLEAYVTQNGSNVHIVIPIDYMGNYTQQQIDTFNAGISHYWSGQIGEYNVTTQVLETNGWGNHITVYQGYGTSGTQIGGPSGHWFAGGTNGSNGAYMAAHEAGHLLGLPIGMRDGYTVVNGALVPKPGFQGNIMGGLNGTVWPRDIAAAIKLNPASPGFWKGLTNSLLRAFAGTGNLGTGSTPNNGGNVPAHWHAGGYSWGGSGWGGAGQGFGYGAFGGVGSSGNGPPSSGSITGSLIGDGLARNNATRPKKGR